MISSRVSSPFLSGCYSTCIFVINYPNNSVLRDPLCACVLVCVCQVLSLPTHENAEITPDCLTSCLLNFSVPICLANNLRISRGVLRAEQAPHYQLPIIQFHHL